MLYRLRKSPGSTCSNSAWRVLATMAAVWCVTFYTLTPLVATAQTGSLGSSSIQIDGNANLFPADTTGGVLNSGASLDWVKDSNANSDPKSLIDSIAVGIDPNKTGAAGGAGHWYGVRIVDGIAGADQDIFLTGGKENDTSTWNPGPGTVGSSKYDMTQAYLSNNTQNVFFGMERRGNNGTTAFDFEFNRDGSAGAYIPVRNVGDVLVTFEMQGSGGSGSATAYIFKWDGSKYAAFCDQDPSTATGDCVGDLVTSINNSPTPPAPWGYVDSKGSWVLTPDIPRFEFAEAQVPLSTLGFNSGCGAAFVQVRTRSSSTATSDLKDTSKIFKYIFDGPVARPVISTACNLDIGFDGRTSTNSAGQADTGLTYSWVFQKSNGAGWDNVGTSTASNGTFTATAPGGRYRANLTVNQGGSCSNSADSNEIDVRDVLTASASKTGGTTATASPFGDSGFVATVTGSTNALSGDSLSLKWQQTVNLLTPSWSDISGATTDSYNLSMGDLFGTAGATGSQLSDTLAGDSYVFRRAAIGLRLHAERTLNGSATPCSANSALVPVKAIKALDP